METNKWPLVRIVVPAFPRINIFTPLAPKTTALGPILVATVINKMWGIRVEVIDENNFRRGPRDKNYLPDHSILQKERPAVIVGFYCGLSSTIERVWNLAEFYHNQGAKTIAGGWHSHYLPEETLKHHIDVVVHGDAELVIRQLIARLLNEGKSLQNIPGISFIENGQIKNIPPAPQRLENRDIDNLPFPDFSLLRYAKIKIYPLDRIRGCSMNCEFCSVKGKPRWASPQHLFDLVSWLVDTRKARHFFIVDDRSEQDIEGATEFFRTVYKKYGNQLHFTVQIRLETARKTELLEIMKKAGVGVVCIGYESPIDEDLKEMGKGYSAAKMLEWTKILRKYFWVHGMFIVGYPIEGGSKIGPKETLVRFREFFRKARLDTVQVMLPIPLIGTNLRQRLEDEGKIFPLSLVPWRKYDGTNPCFRPDKMTMEEFQNTPLMLMGSFYNYWSFFRIGLRIIVFPIDYFIRGWKSWYHGWYRDVIRSAGHILIKRWHKLEQ